MEYYAIGKIAKLSGVSMVTLRHYERIGLLVPAHIDALSSYRYYTLEQSQILAEIIELKGYGFKLEEIKSLLGGGNKDAYMRRYVDLLQERQKLDTTIQELAAKIKFMEV